MKHQAISGNHLSGRRPRLALWLFDGALRRFIRNGTLCVHLPDGTVRRYGGGAPRIAIAIHGWKTLRRVTLDPDLTLRFALPTSTKRRRTGSGARTPGSGCCCGGS